MWQGNIIRKIPLFQFQFSFLTLRFFNRSLPALDTQLPGSRQRQFMRHRVFGDGGAGADGGTLRYCYRCDQLSIGANKNIILDDRLVFIGTIVIARNGAGTDIDVLSDYGIADVTQVICLAACGDAAIFDFDEITDMDVVI